MKYLLCPVLFFWTIVLSAQTISFTDPNFKAALVANSEINTDGDTEISIQEADAFDGQMLLLNMNLTNIDEISYFKNISRLDVSYNQLTALRLNDFPNVNFVNANRNQLQVLELDGLPSINYINVSFNDLDSFNGTGLDNVQYLWLHDNNIQNVDLSTYSRLLIFSTGTDNVDQIDVTNNTLLVRLYLENNNITSLDLSQNLELTHLSVFGTGLSELDVTNNSKLENLNIGSTSISEIDLSENMLLNELKAFVVPMAELDLSNNPLLELLMFKTSEDIDTMDFVHNPLLVLLDFNTESLKYIDVSNNPNLQEIDVSNNFLTQLDLSSNPLLRTIEVEYNNLQYLNIANGQNDSIQILDAVENPDLFCINVDPGLDTLNLPVEWTVDAQTQYGYDCPTALPVIKSFITIDACSASTNTGEIRIVAEGGFLPYSYRVKALNSFFDTTATSAIFDSLKYGDYRIYLIDAMGSVDSMELFLDLEYKLKNLGFIGLTYGDAIYSTIFCPEDNPTELWVEGLMVDDFDFVWSSGSTTSRDTFDLDTIDYNIMFTNNANLQCEINFKGILDSDCISDVYDLDLQTRLNIFPNPTTGELVIVTDVNIDRIRIFDIQGRLVKSIYDKQQGKIDMSRLDEGLYFLHLFLGPELYVKKVIKR